MHLPHLARGGAFWVPTDAERPVRRPPLVPHVVAVLVLSSRMMLHS